MGSQSSRTGFNKDCYTSDNSSHLLHIYPSEYKGLEEAYHHYHHHNHYDIFTTVNPPSQIVSPHPRKLIHISESGKFLLVESRILGFGIRNYAIRNPSSTGKESRRWNDKHGIQYPRYILHGPNCCFQSQFQVQLTHARCLLNLPS